MKISKQRINLGICIVITGILAWESQAASNTLVVALSDSIRPVTHCASGSLYGITETLPSDIDNLIAPLKPNAFNQPAMSGQGRQQPFGDALKVSERIVNTTGKVQIRLADILPGWPYSWPGQASWLASVKTLIQSKIASGRSNYDGYEIWNEPNGSYGTWPASNGDFYSVLWKPTYDLIRSLDPTAKIIGPSYSWPDMSTMSDFLKYCKANNCLPDVISWHQWGSEGFIGSEESYRALETSLGISARPLSINEYSSGTHEYEGSPGVSVPFIAKFERKKVQSAMISWWFTGLPGRLGSLLTPKNEKGGGWWMYKWYGDMTGYMAKVTPPNDKSDGVDAFAAVDKSAKYASIVLGGNSVGSVDVNIGGIPSSFGSSVNIKLESVEWVNKDSAVAGTTQLASSSYTVSNGAITVPVTITSQFYAYRIYITPTEAQSSSSSQPSSSSSVIAQTPYSSATIPGIIEAENYDVGGQDVSYSDNDAANQGGVYRNDGVDIVGDSAIGYKVGYTVAGEWLEYTVHVNGASSYHWSARVSAGMDGSSFHILLDSTNITGPVAVPNGGSWDTYTTLNGTTPELIAGDHTLRIVVDGSYFNIDWIAFSADSIDTPTMTSRITANIHQDWNGSKVYDLSGKYMGILNHSDQGSLRDQLAKMNFRNGIYIVKCPQGNLSYRLELQNSRH